MRDIDCYLRHCARVSRYLLSAALCFLVFSVPVSAGADGATIPYAGAIGLWIHPLWLVLTLFAVLFWLYVTSWVADDSRGVGLNHHLWASILLAAGWVGAILMFFLHPVFFALLVLAVVGICTYYIWLRNAHVPLQYQMFQSVLGTREARESEENYADQRAASPDFKLINEEGEHIETCLRQRPELADAVDLLLRIIEHACLSRVPEVRILPESGAYVTCILKDGVLSKIDTLSTEVGEQIVAAVVLFCDFKERSKARSKITLPEKGEDGSDIQLGVKAIKSGRRTGLVFSLPERSTDMFRKGLNEMSLTDSVIEKLKEFTAARGCAIIISGPPGSGRSTTFYGVVSLVDIFMNDVVTFERRILGELDQVRQIEIDPASAGDWQKALPTVLRDEPHVLAADELPGGEIASQFFEFAAQGGLLIGTKKAGNVVETLTALGKEISAPVLKKSLKAVINQRLVRRLCQSCREEYEPDPKLLASLKINPREPGHWFKPVGCNSCLGIGYDGLTGIYETLIVNENVLQMLDAGNITAQKIRKAVGTEGYRTIDRDGISKVQAGLTTMAEIKRVLR